MGYIFRCLEMVGFMHNWFVKICRIQAYSQLYISKLIFTLNQHKAVYPWGCLMDRFQNSCFQHFIYFFLESFFQKNWNGSASSLLWCYTGIQLNVVWGTWEASKTIRYIRVALKNLVFACDQLGNYILLSRHCRFFS